MGQEKLKQPSVKGSQNEPLVMQRELKFRAWDNLQGGKFEYWDAKTNKYDGVFWMMIKDKSFEKPQQFTGLKDKDGKDIYEGDVVKVNGWSGLNVVRYYNKWAGFGLDGTSWKTNYFHNPFDANDLKTEYEIVGNIYENPKLVV